ncbi:MAG: F0F1 ATP synthase subunit delta [Patescibacteria group bacterium]
MIGSAYAAMLRKAIAKKTLKPEDVSEALTVLRGGAVRIPGPLLSAFRLQLANEPYSSATQAFLARTGGVSVVTIQAAVEPDAKTLASIRQTFIKDGRTLVRLRIEPSLAGGLRLFHDGHLLDASFRGRVRRLIEYVS